MAMVEDRVPWGVNVQLLFFRYISFRVIVSLFRPPTPAYIYIYVYVYSYVSTPGLYQVDIAVFSALSHGLVGFNI